MRLASPRATRLPFSEMVPFWRSEPERPADVRIAGPPVPNPERPLLAVIYSG